MRGVTQIGSERSGRNVETNLCKESADGIFLSGAFEQLGSHVQLLLDPWDASTRR
jgi:hypothetical protein